jgi:hypothetical protein
MFDRVKLPTERHPIEEIIYGGSLPDDGAHIEASGTTDKSGSTEHAGTTAETGSTDVLGITGKAGSSRKVGTTKRTGSTGKDDSTKQAGVVREVSAVSPERDFQKVPNSITRAAMAERLFKGKSKHVWDYLWSQSRGAVVPSRTVRRSRPQIKAAAGFGSMGTVDAALAHLQTVGLVSVKTIVGENSGNEYEVFTPEEVAAGVFGLSDLTSTTNRIGSTEITRNSVLPVIPESGSTGSTLSSSDVNTSGEPKTSFKTIEQKTDDEAFAELVSRLHRATIEVTGKRTTAAEGERWAEVAELLVTELKIAAGRTTVSSAPAFLAEHLRRRLWKKEKRQLDAETASQGQQTPAARIASATQCPDCFGTGMWYPEGYDKGAARCRHEKLKAN